MWVGFGYGEGGDWERSPSQARPAVDRSSLQWTGLAVGGTEPRAGPARRAHTWNLLVELKGISQTLGKRSR